MTTNESWRDIILKERAEKEALKKEVALMRQERDDLYHGPDAPTLHERAGDIRQIFDRAASIQEKWDMRFLALATHIAGWSKDPSTQCGAVIADGKRIVSLGYNGFPSGVEDDEYKYADRQEKYKRVVHAEINALLFARRDLTGCTIYVTPMPPCPQCAAAIIQSKIGRVVTWQPGEAEARRWDFETAKGMFEEAGLCVMEYKKYR